MGQEDGLAPQVANLQQTRTEGCVMRIRAARIRAAVVAEPSREPYKQGYCCARVNSAGSRADDDVIRPADAGRHAMGL